MDDKPNTCWQCGDQIDENEQLCDDCREEMEQDED